MINATLYEELRSGERYERDEVKRPWTAGSKAPTASWSSSRTRAGHDVAGMTRHGATAEAGAMGLTRHESSSRGRAAELLIHASRSITLTLTITLTHRVLTITLTITLIHSCSSITLTITLTRAPEHRGLQQQQQHGQSAP